MTSLFKAGDSLDKNNYRPISSIGTLAKMFEKLMHSRLINFLEKFNILSLNQYGFQKNTSTTDALLKFMSEAHKSLDRKETLILVFLHFSNEFDTVNHTLLLQKLEHMGIKVRPHLQQITATATSVADFTVFCNATLIRQFGNSCSCIFVVKNGEICMESKYNSKFY